MRLLFREAVVLNDPGNCILGVGVESSAEAKRGGAGLSAGESPADATRPVLTTCKLFCWKGPLFPDFLDHCSSVLFLPSLLPFLQHPLYPTCTPSCTGILM